MARKKPPLSTVVDFMSEETQALVRERAGVLSPLPLVAILPDPQQPRQLLPDDLAVAVTAGELSPLDAIQTWRKLTQSKDAEPALSHDFRELQRLAESISQHGLINPISVRHIPPGADAPQGIEYLIITGERRYWAHVLLAADGRVIQEGMETQDPHRIKATIAAAGISIRAHQLIENVMREDIDALEKAQGFLALRHELSGAESDVADGGVNHGSPLVSWTQVEKALNISRRYRQYVTSVLKMSDEAKAIVRQHRLSERAVRPISQKLGARPDLQVAALERLAEWQAEDREGDSSERALTVAVEQMVERMIARDERVKARAATRSAMLAVAAQEQQAEQLRGSIAHTLRLLDKLNDEELQSLALELNSKEAYDTVVSDLRLLREKLENLLETIDAA